MNTNRALITGSNRSGSTWVGKVLAANTNVDTIIEPLNLNRIRRYHLVDYDYWYPKIEGPDTPGHDEIKWLLNYYLEFNNKTFFRDFFKRYEGHGFLTSLKKKWRRSGKPYKVFKDPTALFSVPWMVKEFDLSPVILVRHPAAYCLSIKEKDWWFDFDNFLQRKDFFTGPLAELMGEVEAFKREEKERDVIENAALLWKVFYTQVNHYRKEYPHWYYTTHEELSLDPVDQFERMFSYLQIDFTGEVVNYIIASTQATERGKHLRNSRENMVRWKNNLSTFEKDRIYGITRSVSDRFYDSF